MGDIRPPHTVPTDLLGSANLRTYLEIGRRRKWWIIPSTLGMFICTVVFSRGLPDIYRAETVILVDSEQVPDKYVAVIVTGDIAGRLTTLEQQVLSPTRLKKLIEANGLYPDPTGKLTEKQVIHGVQKSITVEVVTPGAGKMGAFRIAYSSKNRNDVARITNQLAQMFIEENLKAREEQTAGTAEFLHSQLAETKQELDGKDAQLRAIKTHNILELPEAKPYHLEALANLRAQVQTIRDKIQQDESQKNILQSMLASGANAPTVEVEGAAPGNAGGGPYQTQLQKLETKLSDLKSRYGPAHPDVRRTQLEINKLKAKAATEGQGNGPAQPQQDLRPAVQANQMRHNPVLEAQIQQLEEDIQEQSKLLAPLQDRMEFHTSKLEQIPVFEQQIARLQQDYDILRTQYTGLQEKEEAAKISHALEVHQKGERFVILDAAVTPESPAAPNRLLMSLAGFFGGILAGIALAAAAEMNDESVRTENEAARIFGTRVLTGIPRIMSNRERRSLIWRATGLLAGTAAGSAALGFLLAFLAKGLL